MSDEKQNPVDELARRYSDQLHAAEMRVIELESALDNFGDWSRYHEQIRAALSRRHSTVREKDDLSLPSPPALTSSSNKSS